MVKMLKYTVKGLDKSVLEKPSVDTLAVQDMSTLFHEPD